MYSHETSSRKNASLRKTIVLVLRSVQKIPGRLRLLKPPAPELVTLVLAYTAVAALKPREREIVRTLCAIMLPAGIPHNRNQNGCARFMRS